MSDSYPIEIMPIEDTVCCELSRVELIGPLTRLVFTMPDNNERVIVAKLVLPTEVIPGLIKMLGGRPHLQMTTEGEALETNYLRH
jgi:hypothetical protein